MLSAETLLVLSVRFPGGQRPSVDHVSAAIGGSHCD